MTATTAQPSHEPPHERKGTGTRHTEKTSVEREKTTKPRGEGDAGGGREKMARRTQHEGKLNAPMNRMINEASYWACACQRPLISGT